DKSYDSLGVFHNKSLLISCMHFMDPFNFDVDRVKRCVIHYATPDGRIIPFCTMNSIYRSEIEEKFSVPLKNSENSKNSEK
ncbi:MAG: tetraether lipid synthase Tes, partial [Methanobacteriaceae archaeon]